MHALEKILANAAGVKKVTAGEIHNCEIDLTGINDLYLQAVLSFYEMGGINVKKKDSIVVFLDHYAPASSIKQAENHKEFRKFCKLQDITHLMEVNEGVCHQVLVDKGMVAPGKLMIITDSHTTINGAFGAFGTGVGATDAAISMLTGKLWFKVPQIIKINLEGSLNNGVYGKDVILNIIGSLGADYAVYKAIEFTGSFIKNSCMADRMTICNMTTEMGAKTAYIHPDETTIEFMDSIGVTDYTVYETDDDFKYEAEIDFDVSLIKPQLAIPHSVDNVFDCDAHEGIVIDQAYIGTCTGGRVEDFKEAARVLKDKKINKNVRLLLVPASKHVLQSIIQDGTLEILLNAGGTIVTPGCAACLGTHEGILAEGEVCITSANRNFPGRMGHKKAEIYLASPATVAISALEGRVTSPENYFLKKEKKWKE